MPESAPGRPLGQKRSRAVHKLHGQTAGGDAQIGGEKRAAAHQRADPRAAVE